MNERGCIYLRNSSTCGLLDKDDHTYPCADLCAKNECPLRNDEKDPKCWSCQHCGDRSPLYPDFNYCKKRQENVIGHGGCAGDHRLYHPRRPEGRARSYQEGVGMKKIKYLKPTKEQEKIMEAERKAICNLTVPKKRRTPPKCLAHCINLDTYKCMVFCTSGDIHAAGKIFDRHIVSHDGKEKISSVIDRLFENYQPEGDLKMTGRTMDLECDDMICHFPYLYPNPAILAHELLHAVQEILKNKGVHDTNGEADAYLLSQLMEFFWNKFERDRKRYGGHH